MHTDDMKEWIIPPMCRLSMHMQNNLPEKDTLTSDFWRVCLIMWKHEDGCYFYEHNGKRDPLKSLEPNMPRLLAPKKNTNPYPYMHQWDLENNTHAKSLANLNVILQQETSMYVHSDRYKLEVADGLRKVAAEIDVDKIKARETRVAELAALHSVRHFQGNDILSESEDDEFIIIPDDPGIVTARITDDISLDDPSAQVIAAPDDVKIEVEYVDFGDINEVEDESATPSQLRSAQVIAAQTVQGAAKKLRLQNRRYALSGDATSINIDFAEGMTAEQKHARDKLEKQKLVQIPLMKSRDWCNWTACCTGRACPAHFSIMMDNADGCPPVVVSTDELRRKNYAFAVGEGLSTEESYREKMLLHMPAYLAGHTVPAWLSSHMHYCT